MEMNQANDRMTKKTQLQMVQMEWYVYVCGIGNCTIVLSIHGRVYLNWNYLKWDEAEREKQQQQQEKWKTKRT